MNEDEKSIHRIAKGMVTTDPAKSCLLGEKLKFRSLPFPISTNRSLQTVNNWEYFDGALFSIHVVVNSTFDVIGSGFMVGPGIAIIAGHVLEPYKEIIPSGQFSAMCVGISSVNTVNWRIRTITFLPRSDIAILGLEAASSKKDQYVSFALSTRMPAIGETLVMFGFRREKAWQSQNAFNSQGHLYHTAGMVTQQYPTQRDSAMLPWPVLEVNCHSLGSMSGGPVFDAKGYVVGIVTAGCNSESHNGPTYVSMLWPSLATPFKPIWPKGFFKNPTCLLDIDPRLVCIEGRDAIIRNSKSSETYYKVWS